MPYEEAALYYATLTTTTLLFRKDDKDMYSKHMAVDCYSIYTDIDSRGTPNIGL